MIARPAGWLMLVAVACVSAGCRGENRDRGDLARSLPPIFPSGPASTNWNPDAGPIMIVSTGRHDTVGVVLPEATDSTIESLQGITAPVAGLRFDLFGRAGKSASAIAVTPAVQGDTTTQECYSWPLAKLQSPHANWHVGFVSGRVQPITLDSLEAMSGADSSALAVSLAQTAATLPGASDPTFRGLPFRVRSAYHFLLDS